MATAAPAFARPNAMPLPMPLAAPVTTAVLPASLLMKSPIQVLSRTCLELDVQFLNFVRLCFGGTDPFLHVRQLHDALAIGGTDLVERNIIGQKPCYHGRIHRVGRRERSKKVGPLIRTEAFAPDVEDPRDVRLYARPD